MSTHSTRQRRQDASANTNAMPEAGTRSFAPPAVQMLAQNNAPQGAPVQRNEISETVTDDVMTHLNHREGRRRDVYIDSEGYPTGGVGHLMSRADLARYPVGSIVPDSQIDAWLAADSSDAYAAAVQQAIEIRYENQLLVDILTSVNFQSGTRWYEEHANTWRKLKAQQWEAAALEVADSQWFEQTPVRITDFQRVLLAIAGRPNDYDSVRAFNADNIRKWGAVFPSRRSFYEYHFDGASADTGGQTTGGQTSDPATQGGGNGISAAVGLSSSGEFTGTNADTMRVQQLLINAGVLPATRVNQAGETVSNADGFVGGTTVAAIRAFQASVVGMAEPDGRIDVGGGTWTALVAYEGQSAETAPPETEGTTSEPTAEEVQSPTEETPTNDTETTTETPTAAPEIPAVTGTLSGPVGLGPDGKAFVGSQGDIMKVQQLLINNGLLPATRVNKAGDTVSNVDGFLGDVTIAAITSFQKDVLGFNNPDGRIDPGGKTWEGLTGQSGSGYEAEDDSADPVSDVTPTTEPDSGNLDTGNSDVDGGQTQTPTGGLGGGPEAFDAVPANYSGQFNIGGRVGGNPNYVGAPAAQDRARIEIMLRMIGYSLNPTASNRRGETWKRRQLANCIANFQARVPGLARDAIVDPGGNTWKALVVAAYTVSGGSPMSDTQMNAQYQARLGSSSDVPSDLKSKCGGGHLVGIDKSGYLLPDELHTNGRNLATALDTIVDQLGQFSISNAYRSPEHNVKIGSTASASQHVIGYAADIQHGSPGWLKRQLLQMMRNGTIPPGGVGQYSWGVHYDLRGTITDFQ